MQFFGAFFVLLIAVIGWFVLWALIKDPDAPFELRGMAPRHGIDPEIALNRIRVFFNDEDVVFVDDVVSLLAVSYDDAELFLEYLVKEEEIERHGEGDLAVYTRRDA